MKNRDLKQFMTKMLIGLKFYVKDITVPVAEWFPILSLSNISFCRSPGKKR
jgi:hypothetical protein